ncbi:elongator complex protein 5, partial [Tremellales sp. Uapishka_1]
MSDPLLNGVLDNTQLPHQPFLLITDTVTFSGIPVFRELVQRALSRHAPTVLISVLHPPDAYVTQEQLRNSSLKVLDLTDETPGFSSAPAKEIGSRILPFHEDLPPGGQVFIDAIDVLASDYSPPSTLRLVRTLLKQILASKPPSRLTLLLPSSSNFLPPLLSPSLSPTLTHLHAHPPSLISHLSEIYLQPVTSAPAFWMIIENCKTRGLGDDLAFRGESAVSPNWGRGDSRSQSTSGAVVQVLVRKAAGGTKGMSRSLEGLSVSTDGLSTTPLSSLLSINPTPRPSHSHLVTKNAPADHTELNLPFNLTLTEEQKKQRGGVVLPYAHEGEGGTGLAWEDEEEDDEDDEEI